LCGGEIHRSVSNREIEKPLFEELSKAPDYQCVDEVSDSGANLRKAGKREKPGSVATRIRRPDPK